MWRLKFAMAFAVLWWNLAMLIWILYRPFRLNLNALETYVYSRRGIRRRSKKLLIKRPVCCAHVGTNNIPALASNNFASESTVVSRTLLERRCPCMALVHLEIMTLLTLAGLSTLGPHSPPAICPYSHEAMCRCCLHSSRFKSQNSEKYFHWSFHRLNCTFSSKTNKQTTTTVWSAISSVFCKAPGLKLFSLLCNLAASRMLFRRFLGCLLRIEVYVSAVEGRFQFQSYAAKRSGVTRRVSRWDTF